MENTSRDGPAKITRGDDTDHTVEEDPTVTDQYYVIRNPQCSCGSCGCILNHDKIPPEHYCQSTEVNAIPVNPTDKEYITEVRQLFGFVSSRNMRPSKESKGNTTQSQRHTERAGSRQPPLRNNRRRSF